MILEAILLGVLQGVLEWLPVSSQGNLVLIMMHLLKIDAQNALSLSIFLHTGTLLAALAYFRREFLTMLRATPSLRPNQSSRENRLFSFLLSTTILTGMVGYAMLQLLQTTSLSGEGFTALVGVALIVTGLTQKAASGRGERNADDLELKDALILGVAQGFSALPGISRSGVTTSTLLFRRFSGDEALRLSFLMSVPTILVAEVGLALLGGLPSVEVVDLFACLLTSLLFGMLSIHALMRLAKRARFWAFCVIIGVLALLPALSYL